MVSLTITIPCVNVNGKLQQFDPGKTNGPDPLGMRFGSPHQVKKHDELTAQREYGMGSGKR